MRTIRRFLAFGCCVILAQAVASVYGPGGFGTATDVARAQAQEADFESKKIVPFVPTPQEVVDKMLETAEVKKGDVVYDLGSGDGRIVITAARNTQSGLWVLRSTPISSKSPERIFGKKGCSRSRRSASRIS